MLTLTVGLRSELSALPTGELLSHYFHTILFERSHTPQPIFKQSKLIHPLPECRIPHRSFASLFIIPYLFSHLFILLCIHWCFSYFILWDPQMTQSTGSSIVKPTQHNKVVKAQLVHKRGVFNDGAQQTTLLSVSKACLHAQSTRSRDWRGSTPVDWEAQ